MLCVCQADLPVAFAERRAYVAAVIAMRTSECAAQVAAVRRGLHSLIPRPAFTLLTGAELQLLLCGTTDIDLVMLRRHTEFAAPYRGDSPFAERLWRVLATLSQEQLRRFVKFAYAQEQLPATDADWDATPRIRMLVQAPSHRASATQDELMLHADTCFFNVTIPDYSTDAVMRSRILAAIQCEEMFGDQAFPPGDDALLFP